MTVSSQTSTATFVGNGVATAFPLPFRFFDNGDIRAYFIDSVTGAATQMALGSDYTLLGAGEPDVDGGALSLLTTTAPLASMRGLYVERVMPQVQETDIVNQGQFFASTHEDVFDRLTMLIQQADNNSRGAIRVAIGDPEPQRLSPAVHRANLLLGFNSQGDPIAVAPVSGSASDLALLLAGSTGSEHIGRGAGTVETALDALETDVAALEVAQGKEAMFTNSSIFVGAKQATAVLCIGDSNSAGNGQPYGFGGSLMGRTIRSIMNSYDHGIGMDRGYMYESLLALSQELIPARGYSGTGGFVPGPSAALDDRFQLDPGEVLTLTGREIAQMQLWYDPSLSSGDFTTTVDGVTANVHTVGAGGTTGSFSLAAGGAYISPSSTVTVTSTTGTKVITGVQAIRKGGSLSPLVYAAPKGSQGFSDFSAPAVVTDLAAIVNSSSASNRKLIMVLLGTNNMIATVGKQLSPAAYIAQLDALIVAYKAALGGDSLCSFAVWVPPKPLVTLPLGTYQQYVDAIVAYCAADPRISCIRMDKTVLNTADFYSDTLHLNEVGHIIAAHTICRTLGVELDARYPTWPGISQTTALAAGVPVPNGTWSAGSAGVRKDLTGRVFMRGSMSKAAGSGVALLGTLPAAFRPAGATRLVVVADDQGVPRGLTIATSGAVTLVIADPLPVQGVFFDGVSFDL